MYSGIHFPRIYFCALCFAYYQKIRFRSDDIIINPLQLIRHFEGITSSWKAITICIFPTADKIEKQLKPSLCLLIPWITVVAAV